MAKSEDEVRAAVERCLQDCHGQSAPVVKVAECIERLRENGWEAAEIRRVESLVLKVLAAIMSPPNGSGEPERPELM